jgi:tetratricopeptide (TPR) repeat protein
MNRELSSVRKKTPKYLINILLLIISLCVAVIIAEILLRLNYFMTAPDLLLVDDPVLHHIWTPSIRYNNNISRLTNKQSWLEEYDVTLEKPPNTYRIFYVGDSQVQGHVDVKNRMVEIVEKELNKKYSKGNMNFEIINTGTASYSCLLYYLLVKTKILKYAPDLVILNIDMTDVVNDAAYRTIMETDKNGEVTAINPRKRYIITMTPNGYSVVKRKTYFPDWLVHHSRFIRFIYVRLRYHQDFKLIFENQKLNLNANWLATEWSKEIQDSVNFSMEILSKTINLLKSHNVKVFVTGVPHYQQYNGKQSARPHETLNKIAIKNKVPYLNSYRELKDKIAGTKVSEYYIADDQIHFNIKGNQIWAKAQLDFILDPNNRLLPKRNLTIKDFNKATRLKQGNAYDYNNRGIDYSKLGKHEMAIDDFDQAIRLKPDFADAYINRGLTYSKKGHYQLALDDFNQAIRLKPDFADAYINRGVTYLIIKNKEMGCFDAQKACSLGNCKLLEMAKSKRYCP